MGSYTKTSLNFVTYIMIRRDMMLSLTPIFQQIDSYFLAGISKRVAILM
jgi:hypothetical protein